MTDKKKDAGKAHEKPQEKQKTFSEQQERKKLNEGMSVPKHAEGQTKKSGGGTDDTGPGYKKK